MSSASVVRLRPDRGNWAIVILLTVAIGAFFGLVLFSPSPNHAQNASIGGSIAALCLFYLPFPLGIAAWLLIYYVEVDSEGLRWRTIRGRKQVSWREVTDYYIRVNASQKRSHDCLIVETSAGTIRVNAGWSGDFAAFKSLVEQQATSARCSSWQLQGNRLELDGPSHFGYRSGDAKARRVMFFIAVTFGPLATVILLGPKILAALHDPERTYTFLMMGFLALRLNLVTLFGFLSLPAVRDTVRRRDQRIVVSVEGIACEDRIGAHKKTTFLPWTEVRALKILPGRRFAAPAQYLVEGETGSITFTATIHPLRLLTTIVAARATGIPEEEHKWKYEGPDTEDLGGTAAKWTGGCEGVGERVFHYRTRSTRAILWLAGFHLSATQIGALLAALGLNETYVFDWESVVWFVVPVTLLAYLCWRYRAGGIVVSTTGITERKPFGSRTIRWVDVESYQRSSDDSMPFAIVQSRTSERLRFYLGISDSDELTALIAARATSATGSWQRKNAITESQPTRVRKS